MNITFYRAAMGEALVKKYGEAPPELLDLLEAAIKPLLDKEHLAIDAHIEQAKDYARKLEDGYAYEDDAFKVLLHAHHQKPGWQDDLKAFLEKDYPADWRVQAPRRNWPDPDCLTRTIFHRLRDFP